MSLLENFTEDLLEQAAIEIFEELGYNYAFGPDMLMMGIVLKEKIIRMLF